jgi:hypothetical protein
MVFMTLTSINKQIKEIEIKAYIFFIFFLELGLGPAAQLGHWPRPVTRLVSKRHP